MTLRGLAIERRRARLLAGAAAFIDLAKPRILLLVLVTTMVGFYMASPAAADHVLLLGTLLGTGLVAAGALALNQLMERDADALMERTRQRPLPGGRVRPVEALLFGIAATAAGLLWLARAVNLPSAAVTAATAAVYLLVYTPLKRRSPLCTIVGALAGALPPVTGWVAASGRLDVGAAVLFGILFLWQLPHSLALAWLYRDDYRRAGMRLLSSVDPDGRVTGRQIVLNSVTLLLIGPLPTFIGIAGWIYLTVALAMGSWMLADGLRAAAACTPASARRLLLTSFMYVPAVFLAMALDRLPAVS